MLSSLKLRFIRIYQNEISKKPCQQKRVHLVSVEFVSLVLAFGQGFDDLPARHTLIFSFFRCSSTLKRSKWLFKIALWPHLVKMRKRIVYPTLALLSTVIKTRVHREVFFHLPSMFFQRCLFRQNGSTCIAHHSGVAVLPYVAVYVCVCFLGTVQFCILVVR